MAGAEITRPPPPSAGPRKFGEATARRKSEPMVISMSSEQSGASQASTFSPRSTCTSSVEVRSASAFTEEPLTSRSRLSINLAPRDEEEDLAPAYTAWGRKNLEDELKRTREEAREARRHASRAEQEMKTLQREHAKLREQMEIQLQRDNLLRAVGCGLRAPIDLQLHSRR
mmetsp:Transcript_101417/g.325881  ORF Transcript_101417/g.325881 Transcript_101417/m.325881 type:complete len:171 (+) Transcript_101417:101-613(+)